MWPDGRHACRTRPFGKPLNFRDLCAKAEVATPATEKEASICTHDNSSYHAYTSEHDRPTTTGTVIRRATAADRAALAAVAATAYAPYVERIGRRPPPMDADFAALIDAGEVDVDEADGAIRGYIVWRIEPDHVFIENVAVDPRRAGQGIGRALLEWVEHQARAAGHHELRLYTNARMTENLRVYPRRGWVQTARRVEDGLDRVFFRKTVER